jgi:RNA polymerase primary sigma factor
MEILEVSDIVLKDIEKDTLNEELPTELLEKELSKDLTNKNYQKKTLFSIYLQDRLRETETKLLTRDEEKKLAERIRKGDKEAQEQTIKANLRLVIHIAKKYIGRGLEFKDLVQEGNIGLMQAVQKFDPTKNVRFSTYASWWIKQRISRSLADKSRTIRLPTPVVETINRYTKIQRELQQKLKRKPKVDEIAKKMAISEKKLERIIKAPRVFSLETIITTPGVKKPLTLQDIIAQKANNPENEAIKTMLKKAINNALATLTPKEEKILRMRFGINEEKDYTLAEVGKKFNLSRERIRQIEEKAIRKLQHPKRSQKLYHFLK